MKLKYILFLSSLVVASSFYLLQPTQVRSSADTLSLGWENAPRSYDPRYAVDANSQYLEGLLHCSLMTSNADGNLAKDLARSWEWKSGTHLVMKIRSDLTFADGTPVTLNDVKKTYDFFLKKSNSRPSPRALAFRKIKEIKIADESLHFILKEPDASFLSNLVVGILPESLSSKGLITQKTQVKGCGFFVHKKSTLNEITLEKRKDREFKTKNNISFVKIKIVKDPTTRFAKLRKGELDIVQNTIGYQKISTIDRYKELKVVKSPALKTSYLGFNLRNPLLKNLKVRQAIAHAIDKKAIIDFVLKGFATEAKSMLPSTHDYYSPVMTEYSYNPDFSNKLLDEAGFPLKGHSRFDLTITLTNNSTRLSISKVLANNLKKIGINLRIRTVEWGKFKKDVEKGVVDIWLLTWIGYKDPDIYRYAFSTGSFPPNGGNRGWYSNSHLDSLLERGLKTSDISERKKIYQEVSSLVTKDLPYVFLFHENNYAVMRNNVKNFKLFADGHYSSLVGVEKL